MSKHSFAVPADILGTWKVHTASKVRNASGPLRQVSTVQTAGLPTTAQSFCQHRKNVKKNNLCLRPSKKILRYLHIYDGIAAITEGRTHLELCPGRAENTGYAQEHLHQTSLKISFKLSCSKETGPCLSKQQSRTVLQS